MGLEDQHAYSLISAHQLDTPQGELRLVKIRNPWGYKEWNGDWSDSSPKWTPELKEKVNFEKKDDGIFFISFKDYLDFFYNTSICKYMTGGDLSVVEDTHVQGKYALQRFQIEKPYNTPIVITAH